MRIGEVLGNFNINNRGNINSVGIKNKEVIIHTAHRSSKLNDNNNQDTRVIKRGDVFYTELKGGGKHIQKGTKPVIVVQNDVGNKFAPIVNVIPVTSKIHKKLPVHIRLLETDFLPMKSLALCEQNIPIPKSQLMEKVGHLSELDMQNVQKGIMMQFGCIPIEKNGQYLN